jgi:predicted ester cyclase
MKRLLLTLSLSAILLASCGAQAEDTPTEVTNREVVEQIAIAFNENNFDLLDDLIAEDFVGHSPLSPEPIVGLDGLKGLFGFFKASMPDAHHPSYTLIADGDLVAAWMPYEGTFENEMLGLPPTGEKVSVMMANIWEVHDGKATGWWINMDTLSYMTQVGAIPSN